MWLFNTEGCFSITADYKDEQRIQIRARVKKDLYRLMDKMSISEPIMETPHADYAYRIFIGKEDFTRYMSLYVSEMEYTNFKNTVYDVDSDHPDYSDKETMMRQGCYHGIWREMLDMQIKAKELATEAKSMGQKKGRL